MALLTLQPTLKMSRRPSQIGQFQIRYQSLIRAGSLSQFTVHKRDKVLRNFVLTLRLLEAIERKRKEKGFFGCLKGVFSKARLILALLCPLGKITLGYSIMTFEFATQKQER